MRPEKKIESFNSVNSCRMMRRAWRSNFIIMESKSCATSKRKRKLKRSKKHVPTVDSSQGRSNMEVLRMSLKELGWKECNAGASKGIDIYWNSATFQDGNRDYSSTTARVNKFPGMRELMYKSNLTRSLNNMQMLFPDEYDFYPKSWFLPEQRERFENDVRTIHKNDRKRKRRLTTFIVKPSDGSEGAGIYLVQDPTRCNIMNRPYIVQEYIDRPLLLNRLKFDMRIYVLLFRLDPLKILLYNEGLARFATVDYQVPSQKNLHESYMHLTNYSLNKCSSNYKHALDEKQTDASKREMSIVWSQLGELFSRSEIDEAKERIEDMINKTVLAILPELRVRYAMELSMKRKQNQCFQIIGFDVLLTDELKPMLLEVNANPSLRIDFDHTNETGKFVVESSPVDEEIKKHLVLETLKLVMKDKKEASNSSEEQELDSNSDELVDEDEQKEDPTTAENSLDDEALSTNSMKSLKTIFPCSSETKYESMLFIENIAFIYIEMVIKRGYKTMTNWPFRNLAKTCGIVDESTTMSSIDILYTQIFHKCKQSDLYSPATGLDFPAFIEAFYLLARHKYPNYDTLLQSVTELINDCISHLDLTTGDSI